MTTAPLVNVPDLSARLPKLTPRRRPPPPANPTPIPTTPELPSPPPTSSLKFIHPVRRIISPEDHALFLASPTYELILSFVFTLTESIRSTPIPPSSPPSTALHPTVLTILSILSSIETIIQSHPAIDQQGSRFGNPTFRDFLDELTTQVPEFHRNLKITNPAAIDEVSTYILSSFGDRTRIDYGSGHELNFIIWLLCLNRLDQLPASTFPSLALNVFPRYLSLTRLLQTTYYLEPAGSHGVWGLDDYAFLPFLFGASQLLAHPFIRPLSIHNALVLEEFGDQYMYLGQVAFVNSVKNVDGLRWHSPMLDDISNTKGGWAKVEAGMRRMFVAEVLGKRVVMQHFLFGGIIAAPPGIGDGREANDEEGVEGAHVHEEGEKGWSDCCGIKVPGSVAAGVEARRKQGGGLRRVPFD